ncbi:MAG: UDP-N-acetylmuramoyl-tripeptide--D-alanyl-D-alanine ligase [Holosporaceae bacterium]|jgi:UDP-N-acetylmuramoyl-tripeptide--D-alanyl-D-alanine ligase|nr:UDP-N-acetylmuramoyl-tripeptide--D-alanyl-D-alanine ligase [Holosporaceae bacterium]
MIFSKEELSEIFGQSVAYDVEGISINSDDVKIGDLFVALVGERTDGHNFIQNALGAGAVLAISEKHITGVGADRIVMVKSSTNALLTLAKYNAANSRARYVGVTGSIGKTTVKDLIYHLLSGRTMLRDKIYVTKRNFNSQIGLPLCAATMPKDVKFGIFEMGMSVAGEIRKLLEVIQPSISIISQICEAHLEFFNSVWDIAAAKSEIFETVNAQEAAIIPADSPYTDFLKRRAQENRIRNIFTFGSEGSDANVLKQEYINNCFSIEAEILGTKIEYRICHKNISLINNSLPAILAAHILSGEPLQKLACEMTSFSPATRRGECFYLKNLDIFLMDDTYNACPTSLKSAIQSIAVTHRDRRKVLIVGNMLELGKDSVHYHRNLSATVDKFGIDVVFACGSLAKHLFDNLRDCKKGAWCENSAELAEKIPGGIQKGDCVLVKGSNSMKMNCLGDVLKNLE